MNWIHLTIIGALFLVLTNTVFRVNPFGFTPWAMVLATMPLILITQYAFCRAYVLSPSFFSAWFIGTAVCALGAYLAAAFIFHEQIKLLDFVAVGAILFGSYTLIVI
jgi:hypothetical protein